MPRIPSPSGTERDREPVRCRLRALKSRRTDYKSHCCARPHPPAPGCREDGRTLAALLGHSPCDGPPCAADFVGTCPALSSTFLEYESRRNQARCPRPSLSWRLSDYSFSCAGVLPCCSMELGLLSSTLDSTLDLGWLAGWRKRLASPHQASAWQMAVLLSSAVRRCGSGWGWHCLTLPAFAHTTSILLAYPPDSTIIQ